jgi:formylmethanofuran dehydrogenase subunit E
MYRRLFNEMVRCDMCGERDSKGENYKSDDMTYLCTECMQHMEAASDIIRASMESILIGNVL